MESSESCRSELIIVKNVKLNEKAQNIKIIKTKLEIIKWE